MIWRIDSFLKQQRPAPEIAAQLEELGVNKKVDVYFRKVYLIEGDFGRGQAERLAQRLLTDPLTDEYNIGEGVFQKEPSGNQILIAYNPGVYDSVAFSLKRAADNLGLKIDNAMTARFYEFKGLLREEIARLSPKILYNPLVEHLLDYSEIKHINSLDQFRGREYEFNLITADLLAAGRKDLEDISAKGCLSLSVEEMEAIQSYFRKENRNPTDCELETVAVLWSEHCGHKTFRGVIDYQELSEDGSVLKQEKIDGLLKSTIVKATREIASPDCVSVFDDNSGVVKFDAKNNICFKVETHNHPSSLEPYGGASTGIGGVIRDILGTGCAARPFASVDVFCFSPWQVKTADLPEGLLHPKRIMKGVARGVRDYGNRMGIPTVAGAVLFDERFLGNPLVYCGTLGLLPADKSFKEVVAGDLVIVCGAKTGRDGIHGATFSSQELDEQTIGLTSAVQIGNPIEEKKLTEAIVRARDNGLFRAITDCGAGGISSAITELAQDHGVEVFLDKVPLKYKGLSYTDIWISESQERMVLFAPSEKLEELREIFLEEGVEMAVVGKVTGDKRLVGYYADNKVCDLSMDFIFNPPRLLKKAVWIQKKETDHKTEEKNDYNQDLKRLLSAPNIACKDWIIREYDHEVQAGSVVKPVAGVETTAVNDAAVVRPDLESEKCVVIGLGINPFYSDIDPYWMAASAVNEALRNVVSAGGDIDNTFILDNFSWGSPLDEHALAGLVRAAKGCYDYSKYFRVPFISGKDSLYNEYLSGKERIAVPGTLLISAVSVVSDWRRVMTSDFKQSESLVYIIGNTLPEMGGSEYFRGLKIEQGIVPKTDKDNSAGIFRCLSRSIGKGLVRACHDLSEGGLGVALAEMCIGSGIGVNIFLQEIPQSGVRFCYEYLFSESSSRFIVEVAKENKEAFERETENIPSGLIGCTCKYPKMAVYDKQSNEVINLKVDELRRAWLSTFSEFRKF